MRSLALALAALAAACTPAQQPTVAAGAPSAATRRSSTPPAAPSPPASAAPAPPTSPAPSASAAAAATSNDGPAISDDAKKLHVRVEARGGGEGADQSVDVYADGTVVWTGFCGDGDGIRTGHVAPADVKALVAEIDGSRVFAAFAGTTTNASGCSDDTFDELDLDEAGRSSAAESGRCAETPAADRLRAMVARVYDVVRTPKCR